MDSTINTAGTGSVCLPLLTPQSHLLERVNTSSCQPGASSGRSTVKAISNCMCKDVLSESLIAALSRRRIRDGGFCASKLCRTTADVRVTELAIC